MFIVNGVSGSSLHCINFGAATDVCVVTPKVIVLTFKTPVLLFFPYSREAAITVEHAARAFGKEGGLVYRKRI